MIVTSTAKTVSSTSTPVEKIVTPTTGSETICTPFHAMSPAAMAWPASFVTASSCHTSSAMPSGAHDAPAPISTPQGCPLWNLPERNGHLARRQDRHREPEEHRDAAHPRDGDGVHVAVADRGDGADAPRDARGPAASSGT